MSLLLAGCCDADLLPGNDQDAANRGVLRSRGISHVINVTSHVPLHFLSDGVAYLRFPAADTGVQNLRQYFDDAIGFIGQSAKLSTDSDRKCADTVGTVPVPWPFPVLKY